MADSNASTDTSVSTTTDPLVGKTAAVESSLSNWVGPYVTDMLGKAQSLANEPYQAYKGPLTAGQSELQGKAFSGLAGLTVPTSNMGAFNPQSFTDSGVAQQYMNPFLSAAMQPQLDEARRQSQISNLANRSALTKAGAYGGSRQAIMESENQRNLGTQLSGITGKGYLDAFNNAQQQFNKEQDFGLNAQNQANQYGLAALQKQADIGSTQRGIEAEGIAADKAQFEEERDWPFKQQQYLHSMLSGLPLQTQSSTYVQPSGLSSALSDAGGLMKLYNTIFGSSAGNNATGAATASAGQTGTGTGTTSTNPAPADLAGTSYI